MKMGFIGLGTMGFPMASNLLGKNENDQLFIYDIDKKKCQDLKSDRVTICNSIRDVGRDADIIFTMVPKDKDVQSVYTNLFSTIQSGKIYVDMSTITPQVSQELAIEVKKRGGVLLDAPVVKSKPAAVSGTLGIYVGGDEEAYKKVHPLLERMGKQIIHLGENGSGLVMKICHNMLVAQIQNGVNEILTMAMGNNIDLEQFKEAISYGGGQNFYLDSKLNTIKNKNFRPAFSVENMYKDIKIGLNLASQSEKDLPGLNHIFKVYQACMDAGFAKEDFSATFKIVNEDNKE